MDGSEPVTYKRAMTSPDSAKWKEAMRSEMYSMSEKWKEAMRSEMDSMSENQVWDLVNFPEGYTPIGCKWIFKVKTEKDGNVSI